MNKRQGRVNDTQEIKPTNEKLKCIRKGKTIYESYRSLNYLQFAPLSRSPKIQEKYTVNNSEQSIKNFFSLYI